MEELLSFVLISLMYLFYVIIFSFVYGLVIWPCWNLVMPLIGIGKITYLGACCLYVLARVLISGINYKS